MPRNSHSPQIALSESMVDGNGTDHHLVSSFSQGSAGRSANASTLGLPAREPSTFRTTDTGVAADAFTEIETLRIKSFHTRISFVQDGQSRISGDEVVTPREIWNIQPWTVALRDRIDSWFEILGGMASHNSKGSNGGLDLSSSLKELEKIRREFVVKPHLFADIGRTLARLVATAEGYLIISHLIISLDNKLPDPDIFISPKLRTGLRGENKILAEKWDRNLTVGANLVKHLDDQLSRTKKASKARGRAPTKRYMPSAHIMDKDSEAVSQATGETRTVVTGSGSQADTNLASGEATEEEAQPSLAGLVPAYMAALWEPDNLGRLAVAWLGTKPRVGVGAKRHSLIEELARLNGFKTEEREYLTSHLLPELSKNFPDKSVVPAESLGVVLGYFYWVFNQKDQGNPAPMSAIDEMGAPKLLDALMKVGIACSNRLYRDAVEDQ